MEVSFLTYNEQNCLHMFTNKYIYNHIHSILNESADQVDSIAIRGMK